MSYRDRGRPFHGRSGGRGGGMQYRGRARGRARGWPQAQQGSRLHDEPGDFVRRRSRSPQNKYQKRSQSPVSGGRDDGIRVTVRNVDDANAPIFPGEDSAKSTKSRQGYHDWEKTSRNGRGHRDDDRMSSRNPDRPSRRHSRSRSRERRYSRSRSLSRGRSRSSKSDSVRISQLSCK